MLSDLMSTQQWLHTEVLEALRAVQGDPTALPLMLAAAFGFGLLHALLPGHGKALLASFYAAEGRPRDAVIPSSVLILVHVGDRSPTDLDRSRSD